MLTLIGRGLVRIASISLLAGLIGAIFVRLGPGFGTSVQELDPRLSEATRAEMRRQSGAGADVPRYYAHWLAGIAHGDLGYSPSLKRPISELLRDRAGVTAAEVTEGAVAGVLAGFLLAVVVLASPRPVGSLVCGVGSSVVLSAPAAVIALACVWLDIDPAWAVATAVLPHALQYLTGVLRSGAAAGHVLAARARGIGPLRILLVHIMTPSLGELAAVCGMAVTVALGAAIPIEAICSRPGLGELVWQAALSRDLPVLVNMTVLLAVVTIGANTITDVVVAAVSPAREAAR